MRCSGGAPRLPPITSQVEDFFTAFGTGTPACVTNAPEVSRYMLTLYPSMQLKVLPTSDTLLLAEAVENGTCAGAIVPQDELDFTLGYTDGAVGELCELRQTGAVLGHMFRVIPFNVQSPLANATVNGYESNPNGAVTASWFDAFFRIECKATQARRMPAPAASCFLPAPWRAGMLRAARN